MERAEAATQQVVSLVTTYGLNVLGGFVILILGWIAAGWISGGLRRVLARSKYLDETVRGFLASLAKYAVLAFVIIAVLNQFGVQTTSLIAVFGAAGLAVGLALQGTLSNIAAGVMLLIFRPVRVGQYVSVAGQSGTVVDLNLFTVELATPDNVQIIIPNASVWGQAIMNYSHHTRRRADFTLGIGYDDDIDTATAALREVLTGDSRILSEPEPQIVVGELGASSVDLIVRVWVNADDLWPVRFDLTKAFKQALEAKGITIPFPQRTVHVVKETAAG